MKQTKFDDTFIFALMPKGRRNKITASELETLTGANIRTVTAAISRLRQQGKFICSDDSSDGGYYLPKNIVELQEWVKRELKRIETHKAAVKPAADYLKERDRL